MSNDTHKVIGAPDVIWLNYGDIPADTQHGDRDEVSWCDMAHDASDVKYLRADIAQSLLANLKFAVSILSAIPAIGGSAQVTHMQSAIAKAEGVLDESR